MSDEICLLITVLCNWPTCPTLERCAIKCRRNDLPPDCIEYPMEMESRHAIYDLLPDHVRSMGPIVGVEELFEVHVANLTDSRPAVAGTAEPRVGGLSKEK